MSVAPGSLFCFIKHDHLDVLVHVLMNVTSKQLQFSKEPNILGRSYKN